MVKIVLFTLIFVSSLSSIANASSGFYVSVASLTSKQNATSTQKISAENVIYGDNTRDLKFLTTELTSYAYAFKNGSGEKTVNLIDNMFIPKDIKLTLILDNYDKTNNPIVIKGWGASFAENRDWHDRFLLTPIDYTSQISTVKSMVASEHNTPNFTISNSGEFEFSAGYKLQKEKGTFFISPQIDYSSFGSNSSSMKTSALGIVAKFGASASKANIYGFCGYSSISNSSNGSTQKIGGLKYGFGTEFSLSRNISLFAEVFQIDLQNNTQSVSYSASSSVREYIDQNSKPEKVTLTNDMHTEYDLTLNQLGLNNYIDPDSIKINRQTSIKSITGFKVGATMYFNHLGNDESYF